MTENLLIHKPVPWIGQRVGGQVLLEILFSTIQESWGIRFYLEGPDNFDCHLYPAMAELARRHVDVLSKLITDCCPADDLGWYCSDKEMALVDEMLVSELELRARMVQALNAQVVTHYPSRGEWDQFAEALQYLSNCQSALAARVRYFRRWMDQRNLNPVELAGSDLEAVA